MAKIPVLAYFYSKKEENLIQQYLKDFTRTDSFYYGLIESSHISLLAKNGILIDIPDTPAFQAQIPRRVTSRPVGKAFSAFSVKEVDSTVANYYLIRLYAPLFDAWKQELTAAGIKIVENLQNNIYKIFTTRDIPYLRNYKFIAAIRPYRTGDKDIVVRRSLLSGFDLFDTEKERVAIYDIRVRQDTTGVLSYLKERNVPILGVGQHKIRVRLTGTALIGELSKNNAVQAIEEYTKPELYNDQARRTINIEKEAEHKLYPIISYAGEGQLIGVADTGIDSGHPDFEGRIHKIVARGREGDHSDPHGHGTHVAGSILGNGTASDGLVKGMAPQALLFFQSVLDDQGGLDGLPVDLHELFQEAYDEGVRIHNNSWGALAESEYRFNSLEVDEFVYQHKDMLLVISGGNEGTAFQPRNSKPGFVDWLSLGAPATAKNALTVGASRSSRTKGGFASLTHGQAWPDVYPDSPIREERISGDIECMAGFSSRGPCGNESRIKPDVVAPGTDIASCKSSLAPTINFWGPYPGSRRYAFMGGTSMAAPIVTGFAALIREYLLKERKHAPSAALMRAIIVNSTRILTGKDALADHGFIPNFHQGFGCIDMQNALPNTHLKELALLFKDSWQQPELQFNSTGQRFLFSLTVKEGLPLRLCLVWTDPPGRGLQNNLNLFLMHKASQHKWTGNEEVPRTITAFDRDNNVEIIRIAEPPAGTYLIAVQAANIIFSPQDFALVVTGRLGSALRPL